MQLDSSLEQARQRPSTTLELTSISWLRRMWTMTQHTTSLHIFSQWHHSDFQYLSSLCETRPQFGNFKSEAADGNSGYACRIQKGAFWKYSTWKNSSSTVLRNKHLSKKVISNNTVTNIVPEPLSRSSVPRIPVEAQPQTQTSRPLCQFFDPPVHWKFETRRQ